MGAVCSSPSYRALTNNGENRRNQNMNDLLSQALELAEEFPVFPCNSKKQPVCAGGFKAATQDADELTRLFSTPNATLIGMPTGSPSGISVVDIDVNDGKGGEAWLNTNKQALGLTKVVRTKSGGWHYYYKHHDVITNRADISSCVDIRGEGGYVIAVPSEGYTLLMNEDLADFPDFLIGEKVQGGFSPNDTQPTTDIFGAITDGREKYMSDLVYATVKNYIKDNNSLPTEEWMVENVFPTYMLKIKSRTGDLESEDRGIKMFMKKVRSTIAKQKREGVAERGEFDDPLPTVELPEFEDDTPTTETGRYKSYRFQDLEQLPPPKFLIAPYIVENSFACLFGAPASYKSFLSLDWALSIAHGVDWNGRATEKGTVVYLAMEGQAGLMQRIRAWHNDNGLDPKNMDFLCFIMPLSLAEEATEQSDVIGMMGEINRQLGNEKPKLVIVDTLARSFTGKDENNATDMGIFVRNMDIIKHNYKCTVIAVHHSGKDETKGMRGSSSLRGAIDTELEIKRKADTMSVCLKVKKQKDTEEADPLWMDAREVSWLEDKFGIERTSLVLDPSDAPPKAKPRLSDKQKIALDILDDMLNNEAVIEKDFRGNYGVSESYWRENVEKSLPEMGAGEHQKQNWYKFKERLVEREFITIINTLVNKCYAK